MGSAVGRDAEGRWRDVSLLVIDVGTSGAAGRGRPPRRHRRPRALPAVRCPTRRRRASSSSTPPAMAEAALEVAREALGRGRPGRRGRHHQPAGLDDRVGPRDRRARRPGARLAGPAHHRRPASCWPARASASPRTSRPPRSRACSTPTTRTASRDLCFGTVDTWIAWTLSEGALHVTDRSNAGVTGLLRGRRQRLGRPRCSTLLRIPRSHAARPSSTRPACVGAATALAGRTADRRHRRRPAGVAHRPGRACARAWPRSPSAPAACSTSCLGAERPRVRRHAAPAARFPIVAWRRGGAITWGVEAIMLSAGTNVEWLRDDLGLIATAAESHDVAAQCDTAGGVVYVPALLGLGHAALGLRRPRHPARPHPRHAGGPRSCGPCSRASPSGAPTSSRRPRPTPGSPSPTLRVDGGMSANPTFVQALADATQRPVEVSPVAEATTLGAAFLAGLAVGTWSDVDDIAATWRPRADHRPGPAPRPGALGRGRRPRQRLDSLAVGTRLLELGGPRADHDPKELPAWT